MIRVVFVVIFTILVVSTISFAQKDEAYSNDDGKREKLEHKHAIMAKVEEILEPIKKQIHPESWQQIIVAWEENIDVTGTEIMKILFDTLQQLHGEVPHMFQKLALLTMIKNDIESEVWEEVKHLLGYETSQIDRIVNVIEMLKDKMAKDIFQEFQLMTVIQTYKEIIPEDKLNQIVQDLIAEIKDYPELFDVIPISAEVVGDELRNLDPDERELILERLKERLAESNIKDAYGNTSMYRILNFIKTQLNTKEIMIVFREVKETMAVQENTIFAEVLLERISSRFWDYILDNFVDLIGNNSEILEYIPVSLLLETVDETLGDNVAENIKENLRDRLHKIPELTKKLTVASLLHSLKTTKPELWENLKLDDVLLKKKDELGAIYDVIKYSKDSAKRFRDTEALEQHAKDTLEGSDAFQYNDSDIAEEETGPRKSFKDGRLLNPDLGGPKTSAQVLQDISPEVIIVVPEVILDKVGEILKGKLGVKTELVVKKIEWMSGVLTMKTLGASDLASNMVDYVKTWSVEDNSAQVGNFM